MNEIVQIFLSLSLSGSTNRHSRCELLLQKIISKYSSQNIFLTFYSQGQYPTRIRFNTTRGGSRLSHWGGHTNFSSSGMYFGWTNEGAKRPRIEGEARTEGEARDKAGGGVWGGGSVSPSPENF